jgi:hypothetical protein
MHRKKVQVLQDLHQKKEKGPADSFKGFQQESEEAFLLKIEMIQRPIGRRTLKGRGGASSGIIAQIGYFCSGEPRKDIV